MNWPKSTVIGKFLSKESFYAHEAVSGSLKQALVDDIEKMTIMYRLAQDTLNVDTGTEFPEILVLQIKLKHKNINERLLDALDKAICAGYVLFVLEYMDMQCASISHKTINTKSASTIDKRWVTEWKENIDLEIQGTTIDKIYSGFIEQISGGRVNNKNNDLNTAVDRDIERTKIEKQIADLERKFRNTDQLNKKFEIKEQINELVQKLKELS